MINAPEAPATERKSKLDDTSSLVHSTVLSFLDYQEQLKHRRISLKFLEVFFSQSGIRFHSFFAEKCLAMLKSWNWPGQPTYVIYAGETCQIPKPLNPLHDRSLSELRDELHTDDQAAYRAELIESLEKIGSLKEPKSIVQRFFHNFNANKQIVVFVPCVPVLILVVPYLILYNQQDHDSVELMRFTMVPMMFLAVSLVTLLYTLYTSINALNKPYIKNSLDWAVDTKETVEINRLNMAAMATQTLFSLKPDKKQSEVDWVKRLGRD